jgi:uncharacterized protein YqeY
MILETLIKQKNDARKHKDTAIIPFLSLLISQIQMVGKNDGGRDTTEDEALRVIKKMISANEETMVSTTNDETFGELMIELNIMKPLLPQMVSADAVNSEISLLVYNGVDNIGAMMGGLKKKFGSTVDMKMASAMARAALA